MSDNRILGAILAGGRSRRFGSDKALARMADGRTLIEHAIAAMLPHVDKVVVCGRTAVGLTCLADRPAPGMGPLVGLNAALHHALEQDYAAVMTSGCDMPIFPAAIARMLPGDGPAILEGQQLVGYWPASLAPALDAHLAGSDDRSIRGWLDRTGARSVIVPDLVLPNINHPADLTAFERRLSGP